MIRSFIISCILLALTPSLGSCQMNPSIVLNVPGARDQNAPTAVIATSVTDPVLTSSVLTYITFTKSPISGFTSGDIALTNCTLSSFTQVSSSVWSFYLNPVIDGTFTAQLGAATVTWNSISNTASNLLSKTYDSGTSYDLQNGTVSISQHTRGHVASFSDCNDLLSSLSVPGMELIHSLYNFGSTMFANGDNQANRDMNSFGRVDFGIISIDASNFDVVDALITTLRGSAPSTNSYKNGDDSYKASIVTKSLFSRNSGYENVFAPFAYTYATGITQTDFSSRQVLIRWDYYAKGTGTDYYRGTYAQGVTNINAFVNGGTVNGTTSFPGVIPTNGWYTDFIHWHWQISNYPELYYSNLSTAIGSSDVFRGTMAQAAEYYWVKEAVDNVSASGNTITVTHSKKYASAPYSRITAPAWIHVVTTGTVFAGNEIAVDNGMRIRKVSTNNYYVPMILDFSGSTSTCHIGITTAPNYVNLTQPVVSRSGANVTVDQPCKFTIFRVQKPTSLTTSVSSATIPTTDNVSMNLTVGTGLSIATDATLKISNDASHYFYATVTSYNSGTGALVVSSSGPTNVGTGTFSSWTIQRYYHLVTATVIERSFTYATSYVIQASRDETNYDYWAAVINQDGISNAAK